MNDFHEFLSKHLWHSDSVREGMAAENRVNVPSGAIPLDHKKAWQYLGGVNGEQAAPLPPGAVWLAGMTR